MKKTISLILVSILVLGVLAGCTPKNSAAKDTPASGNTSGNEFNTNKTINVVSRENGSGTRGAFVEIVGILEKDSNGNEVDRTYEEAIIQNSTDGVMTTVSGDKYSIGYISLGSINDSIKGLKIQGIEANAENVQNGSYKIARPFNIAYKGELSPLGKDFVDFILSAEGQEIVVKGKYVQVGTNLPSYNASGQKGNLVIAGSTSVSPIMEKLAEAYQSINSGVNIEIQSTGSSAGMQSAIEGTADIGMASRDLKASELEILTHKTIAMDGIAVITNIDNSINDLTLEQVKSIYTGEITKWNEIEK